MDLNISLSSVKNKRVLISPLNWGLGHVMRCVPLIERLVENKNEVIICCDEQQDEVFRTFFPSLWYVTHQGYPFVFRGNGRWEGDLMRSFTKLRIRLQEGKLEVSRYVSIFNPDLILSDQRYGFRSPKVPSIFITHQLVLPVEGIFRVGQFINRYFIQKFDSTWVYDSSNNPLAGKLSYAKNSCSYLGVLSRFNLKEVPSFRYKFTAIISGPKPYSEDFFDEVKNKLMVSNHPCVIVSNTDLAKRSFRNLNNCIVLVNPSHSKMEQVLNETEFVISRAGYTTFMDLTILNKKALLIPTNGQKEQLYLSSYHKNHQKWNFYNEDEFRALDLSQF